MELIATRWIPAPPFVLTATHSDHDFVAPEFSVAIQCFVPLVSPETVSEWVLSTPEARFSRRPSGQQK